jgi:hypothetical protein
VGIITQNGNRGVYERAFAASVAAFESGGMSRQQAIQQVANGVLTQSYLKLVQPLSTGLSVFPFPVLKNEAVNGIGQRNDEKRLNQQDTFFVSNAAFYIAKGSSATATNLLPNTYPNAITYPTGTAQLLQLYAGRVEILINQSVIGPGFDMLNFYQVPQTQLTGATNTPQDQFDPSQVGIWEPNINFVGTKGIVINVVLPNAMTALDSNVVGIWIFRGIQAQNVTLMS